MVFQGTVHAIEEVCDLEININSPSELLDSGMRTEFTHITVSQRVANRVASTQDRIGAAGPPEERSNLRSAGGFLDEESVICNHRFGNLRA